MLKMADICILYVQGILGCWISSARLHGAWAGGRTQPSWRLQTLQQVLLYMQPSASLSRLLTFTNCRDILRCVNRIVPAHNAHNILLSRCILI